MARPIHATLTADAPAASIAVLAGAIAFHLLGSALLVFGAPPLAALHAFAAFIVLAVVATSHQLIPVLLRVPAIPWLQSVLPAAGFALGFALLVASFLGLPEFAAAGTVLAISAAAWCALVGSRILRAAGERQTAAAMGSAFSAFLVAAFAGVWMAYDLSAGAAPGQRTAMIHGTLMIAVFASMLVVALSYRFVPMFSLSHANAYGARTLQWVFLAGSAAVAFNAAALGAGLNFAALCALGYQHWRTLAVRLRKRFDASLVYAAAAWIFALAAALLVLFNGLNANTAVPVLALSVMGWLSITIFGYGLKICGFLGWQFARQRSPESTLMPLANAIPQPGAYASLACLSLGCALFALDSHWNGLTQIACAVYLTGALAYAATFAAVAYPYMLTPERKQA